MERKIPKMSEKETIYYLRSLNEPVPEVCSEEFEPSWRRSIFVPRTYKNPCPKRSNIEISEIAYHGGRFQKGEW